jgi:hypothetical protein
MVGQIAWENGIDDGADGGDDAEEEEDCASDLKKGKRQGTIQTAAAQPSSAYQ